MKFYFGFRSPYAWLTNRQMNKKLSATEWQKVEAIPYWPLEDNLSKVLQSQGAEMLYKEMSRSRLFYILEDIKRLAKTDDVALKWPVDSPTIDWNNPHFAYLAAKKLGKGRDCINHFFKARFEQGLNITDKAVIETIAENISIEPSIMLNASKDETLRTEAVSCLMQAFKDSVFGLPFFVVERKRFWGSDRLSLAIDEFQKTLFTKPHTEIEKMELV